MWTSIFNVFHWFSCSFLVILWTKNWGRGTKIILLSVYAADFLTKRNATNMQHELKLEDGSCGSIPPCLEGDRWDVFQFTVDLQSQMKAAICAISSGHNIWYMLLFFMLLPYYIILYQMILYYIIAYFILLHYVIILYVIAIIHYTISNDIIAYFILLHYVIILYVIAILFYTIWNDIIQYEILLNYIIWHWTILYIMLHCIILYIMLHCIYDMLCYIVSYFNTLFLNYFYIILHDITWYYMILHDITWYYIILHYIT